MRDEFSRNFLFHHHAKKSIIYIPESFCPYMLDSDDPPTTFVLAFQPMIRARLISLPLSVARFWKLLAIDQLQHLHVFAASTAMRMCLHLGDLLIIALRSTSSVEAAEGGVLLWPDRI